VCGAYRGVMTKEGARVGGSWLELIAKIADLDVGGESLVMFVMTTSSPCMVS